jgi:predicted permease
MRVIAELWRRAHYLFNRRRLQRELAEELEAHRAEMGDRRPGFGSSLKLREDSNDAWGFGWFDRLWQDVHYGARILRKSPGFTLTAVAILALGIGLNVTAFGFLNVMALKPLPVPDPKSIVLLWRSAPGSMADNFSYLSFDFYRRHNTVFSKMWAIRGGELLLDSGEKVRTRFVTSDFFGEMGGFPELGRFLSPAAEPGGVVLSHRFWQGHFGGDSSIVGRKIRFNKYTAVVLGVAPPKLITVAPEELDVWAPLTDYPLYFPNSKILTDLEMMSSQVYGRLRPGISSKAAEAGLRPIVDQYRQVSPNAAWKDEYLPLYPGGYAMYLNAREMAILPLPAALLLLVLAATCANLGNLMLARGAMRAREIAIRSAAGAGRARIVRQLFTESVMLSLLGAAASIPLSMIAIRLFIFFADAPDSLDFTPDWRVCVFALVVALLAAVLFGLAPALRTSRPSATGTSRTRLVLVAAQVATSCILVILSGLMTRALERGLTKSPGFSFAQSANIFVGLSEAGFKGHSARLFLDRFRARINQVPGVESVALSILPPLGNSFAWMGHPVGNITMHGVDGHYFDTMRIPLLAGRSFLSTDPDTNIIVGERLAQRLWPGANALGKDFIEPDSKAHWTVIGVAANAPVVGFGDNDTMELYRPLTDRSMEFAAVVVRTANIDAALSTLQQVATGGDGMISARLVPMREGYENRLKGGRMAAMSISALGGVALLVAIVGLAGLISYAVTQRTREIGIRMALGAKPSDALRVGLSQLVKPVGMGMLIGIAAAAGLAQTLRFTLYGLSTVDPVAYVSALLLFAALVAIAAIPPLRRAARVDPATALRHD